MSVPPLNLLRDPWLPVRRRSGASEVVSVADALGAHDDPVVALDWSRPDFDAAGLEFLIGLLSTIVPPGTTREWRARWDAPPDRDAVAALLEPYAAFFHLDGAGPRFLQDFGDLGNEASPISGLLIEQPGANTVKNNTDLFQKRGRIETLGRSTAAMALFTLQCFAPSGGAGHRTGLRGGGPLTTLVGVPTADGAPDTLWRRVWANVVPPFPAAVGEAPILEAPARTFPWLEPTRTSDKSGAETHLVDVHPAQCFWGMPRRIRLIFEANTDAIACDVTGRVEEVIVRSYVTRPYGVNYVGIEHPLSPQYRAKAGAEWLPVHPQPGGIAWRHWPGFLQETKGASGREARPAAIVRDARQRLADLGLASAGLSLHGYDMDNMKARAFVETAAPLFVFADDDAARSDFELHLDRLVASASQSLSILTGCLRAASGRDGGARLDLVQEAFWAETEPAFRDAVATVRGFAARFEETGAFFQTNWIGGVLARTALAVFDREVPAETMAACAEIDGLRRAVEARRNLTSALRGFGKAGGELFVAAGLAPPAGAAKSKAKPKKGAAQ